jgi:condensin complex subunit 3
LGNQFLSAFDVLSSQVAEEALGSVLVTRPEVMDQIELDGEDALPPV